MSIDHLHILFGESLSRPSAHFLTEFCLGYFGGRVLNCMGSSYTLNINPLSDIPLANNFSHSEGYLFVLLMIFFAVQKLFKLM